MSKYMSGKKASNILGVHQRTLYQWDKKGYIYTIRTPGGKRLYNVEKFLNNRFPERNISPKLYLSYARVSSKAQINDLDRQKKLLKFKYPNYQLITDVGSGINFNRIGLRKIINFAISGVIAELVIVHKDRLTRFGYELIEDLIKQYSNGKITVLNKPIMEDPKLELAQDVLQLMNVYVAKMNGLRKYKIKDK